MTIDDEKSVYVGGIPNDATEDILRPLFDIYGKIIAIKIVNDSKIGGKCYAFITYTNPRSALHAIAEMDGTSIDGRIVRVNEVRTRGGFRRGMDMQRDAFMERDRNQGGRVKSWDRDRNMNRGGYGGYHDRRRDRERGHGDGEQSGDQISNQGRDEFRGVDEFERNGHTFNDNRNGEVDGTSTHGDEPDKQTDQPSKKRYRSTYSVDHESGQLSETNGDPRDQEVAEQLDRAIHKRSELQNEISLMEEKLKERQQLIYDLQRKSQKLEDSLTAKKKLVSDRQMQQTKLHKCFMRVKDYNEKLKHSENELQSLVDSEMIQAGNDKEESRDEDGLVSLSA